ncbi:polysaccharide pyruvyl transferase family protein [Streptomyces hirsutus]|uniref:polysaccharide pyruvyl transferase family protein n=1 Tax=Streptomyces hirsutus TaxID=35620 RepID=UPI0036C7C962
MGDSLSAVLKGLLGPGGEAGGRVLLTGWFSFPDGEVTAGDALAQSSVSAALSRLGVPHDTAWSPGYAPNARSLDSAPPGDYEQVLFVCGPVHGEQLVRLHERYAGCRRVALGVSVVDPGSPAVTGFDRLVARDGPGCEPQPDLSTWAAVEEHVPVAGVALTYGQGEYGARRGHESVAAALTGWLAGKDCVRVAADTRLAIDDWRLCRTTGQFMTLMSRLDIMITDRLHGMVLALRAGVPAVAVDPVRGGAKVSAQAAALRWPALLTTDEATPQALDRWWSWCLSPKGRDAAGRRAALIWNGRR